MPFLTAWIEQPFCTAYEQGRREPKLTMEVIFMSVFFGSLKSV